MDQNLEHLKLLGIFHYVVGIFNLLFSFFPVIYLVLGVVMIVSPESMSAEGELPPVFLGYLFTAIGGFFFLAGIILSVCMIYSGRMLRQQKKYMFSFVVACIECLIMPFGTVLGIFTLVVLTKAPVKLMYDARKQAYDQAPPPLGNSIP